MSQLDDLPEEILDVGPTPVGFDPDTLSKYSHDGYTDDLLGAFD